MNSIKPRNLYCAYLDILGFKDIVQNWEYAKSIYSDFENIIPDILFKQQQHSLILNSITNKSSKDSLKYFIISDSIILTHHYFDPFLFLVPTITCYLMKKNIFIRGGLSFGKHYNHYFQGNHLILSQSLTGAYIVEKNIKYPICVLDSQIFPRINEYLTPLRYNVMLGSLVQCEDQNWGINPFFLSTEEELDELKSIIENELAEYAEEKDIYLKYLWLYRLLIQWINLPKLHWDAKEKSGFRHTPLKISKKDVVKCDSYLGFVFLLPDEKNNNAFFPSQLGKSFNENAKSYPFA